jgi:hypothetical protein
MIAISEEPLEIDRQLVCDQAKALNNLTKKRVALLCIVVGFWIYLAGNFIFRTSHVSVIDGVRYFTIVDDGMISMRYAKNFVQHQGLVWNVGERVEGFTNPLWTFAMVGAIWAFGTHYAPLGMEVLGGVTCLALFAVFVRAGIKNKGSKLGLEAGLLLLVFSYPISYWGLSGMEATAVCLVFAAAASAQYGYENGGRGNPLILHSCLIAVAYCLRPDGWLPIIPFFAASLFDSIKDKNYSRPIRACAIPGCVVLLVTAARLFYYGHWVPNTYVLKVEGYGLLLRLRNGTAFVDQFWAENSILLVLIALAALSRRRIALLNIFAAFITFAYQVYVGGDPWLSWRQLLPVYVVGAFAVMIILDMIEKLSTRDSQPPSLHAKIFIVLITSAPIVALEYQLYQGDTFLSLLLKIYFIILLAVLVALKYIDRLPIKSGDALLLGPVARVLVVAITIGSILVGNSKFLPEFKGKPASFDKQAKLIDKAMLSNKLFGAGKTHHMAWAGTYPYFVDGKMIDALGKSDETVARYPVDETVMWGNMKGVPGHSKHDFRDTILKRAPDVIIDYLAWGNQDVTHEIKDGYSLLQFQGVSLCVRNDDAANYKSLNSGSCPRELF